MSVEEKISKEKSKKLGNFLEGTFNNVKKLIVGGVSSGELACSLLIIIATLGTEKGMVKAEFMDWLNRYGSDIFDDFINPQIMEIERKGN